MLERMENYPKLEATLDENSIKEQLISRLNQEDIPNFQNIIKQISESFVEALESDDYEQIKNNLKTINLHNDYLGEKYRDTPEERAYLKTVEAAIDFIENKLKTFHE